MIQNNKEQTAEDDEKAEAKGVEKIAKLLCKGSSSLDLTWRNRIGPELVKHVTRALLNNTLIEILNLSCNDIGDTGAKYVSQLLSKNTTLEQVILQYNNIGPEGLEHLAQALSTNTSLKVLCLSGNPFFYCIYLGYCYDNRGAKALAKALLKNTSLQSLYLSSNRFADMAKFCICNALKINPSLQDFKGIQLEENQDDNSITLRNWRLELQDKRRKIQRILIGVVGEIHLVRNILKMESAFPLLKHY